MENTRFTELLNLYLNNKATEDELQELMQLIREGYHDEQLRGNIDEMLLKGNDSYDIDARKAEQLLKQITSTSIKPPKVVFIGWRWAAAAAVLICAVSVGWWMARENSIIETLVQNEKKLQPSVFSGKQFVRLPDGSTAILNHKSQLSYGSDFGTDARAVILSGEAFFDIQHNPSKPFKVITGDVTTTVLGTAFNVRAYPGQGEIKVTVSRGKVQVDNKKKTLGIIIPDQQIAVNTTTDEYVQTNTKAEAVIEWKSKYLILNDVSMETAAAIIEEKYNTKIIFVNEKVKECRITATFLNGEDIEQVLTVVSGVLNATYTTQPDGNIRLDGKGCE
jgi:transmembrane sensor